MPRKVLIAEDETNILASLEFLMCKDGYEVRVTMRGDEVLSTIRDFQPDLILLDVMLPRRNGFELCADIRANTDWRAMKIIILSAKGRDAEMQRGLDAGADAYVTKPFATSELREQVKRLINP
jgi:two-component system, OmpR family, alkaline phosphatase synthesis response regulator PhoP